MKLVIDINQVDKSNKTEAYRTITPKIIHVNPITIPSNIHFYIRYIEMFQYNLMIESNFHIIQYKPRLTKKPFKIFSNYSIHVSSNNVYSILLESTETNWFYEYYREI